MINLPYHAPPMSQIMTSQNVPVQTSHNNFPMFQQPQMAPQQMQNGAAGVYPQEPFKQPFYQLHQADAFVANQQYQPNVPLQRNPWSPLFQANPNYLPALQAQPNLGSLPQNVLDQIRGCVSTAAPIFILPGGCHQPTSQGASQPTGQTTGANSPIYCPPPSFYPFPVPMPMFDPFGGQARDRNGGPRNCSCCPRKPSSFECKSYYPPSCCCNPIELEEHQCTATNDDTICSKRNCPASVSLQALASQLLSLPGIISCAATRLILRKVPGSNIISTMEDTMEKAQRSIAALTKDQLLNESRNAQQVNALINLHMTTNPPANIIPLLTLLQLKVNILKAQIESLINKKVMECQGFCYDVDTCGPIDPTVLSMKNNAELRQLLAALRQKECDERVNVNFSPYHSQKVIAEARLNNVQAKIRQVENEFERRRESQVPSPTLTSRIIQQFSESTCTYGFAQPRLFEPYVQGRSLDSPDPFAHCIQNPRRLYLKPREPEPEPEKQKQDDKAVATAENEGAACKDAATGEGSIPCSKDQGVESKSSADSCSCCEYCSSDDSFERGKKKLRLSVDSRGNVRLTDSENRRDVSLFKLAEDVVRRIRREKCRRDHKSKEEIAMEMEVVEGDDRPDDALPDDGFEIQIEDVKKMSDDSRVSDTIAIFDEDEGKELEGEVLEDEEAKAEVEYKSDTDSLKEVKVIRKSVADTRTSVLVDVPIEKEPKEDAEGNGEPSEVEKVKDVSRLSISAVNGVEDDRKDDEEQEKDSQEEPKTEEIELDIEPKTEVELDIEPKLKTEKSSHSASSRKLSHSVSSRKSSASNRSQRISSGSNRSHRISLGSTTSVASKAEPKEETKTGSRHESTSSMVKPVVSKEDRRSSDRISTASIKGKLKTKSDLYVVPEVKGEEDLDEAAVTIELQSDDDQNNRKPPDDASSTSVTATAKKKTSEIKTEEDNEEKERTSRIVKALKSAQRMKTGENSEMKIDTDKRSSVNVNKKKASASSATSQLSKGVIQIEERKSRNGRDSQIAMKPDESSSARLTIEEVESMSDGAASKQGSNVENVSNDQETGNEAVGDGQTSRRSTFKSDTNAFAVMLKKPTRKKVVQTRTKPGYYESEGQHKGRRNTQRISMMTRVEHNSVPFSGFWHRDVDDKARDRCRRNFDDEGVNETDDDDTNASLIFSNQEFEPASAVSMANETDDEIRRKAFINKMFSKNYRTRDKRKARLGHFSSPPLKHRNTNATGTSSAITDDTFYREGIESDCSSTKYGIVSWIYSMIENQLVSLSSLLSNASNLNFNRDSRDDREEYDPRSTSGAKRNAREMNAAYDDWVLLPASTSESRDSCESRAPPCKGCSKMRKIRHSIIVDREKKNYLLIRGSVSGQMRELSRIGFNRPYQTRRSLVIRSRPKNPGTSRHENVRPKLPLVYKRKTAKPTDEPLKGDEEERLSLPKIPEVLERSSDEFVKISEDEMLDRSSSEQCNDIANNYTSVSIGSDQTIEEPSSSEINGRMV